MIQVNITQLLLQCTTVTMIALTCMDSVLMIPLQQMFISHSNHYLTTA